MLIRFIYWLFLDTILGHTPLLSSCSLPKSIDNSLASCPDLLSFRWLSNIMSRSPIISTTLRHRVWIPYYFDGSLTSFSDPIFFGGSSALCLDPLSFRQLSNIVFRSLIFSAALWHHVWILYLFDGSPTSCPDPLSFFRLFDIMSGSSFFSAALRHRIQIPYLFGGSPESCLDPLSFQRLSNIVFESPIISMVL